MNRGIRLATNLLVLALVIGVLTACGETEGADANTPEISFTVGNTTYPESTPPVEPEYSIFNDPNVLWGSGEDSYDMDGLSPGEFETSYELDQLLASARENNLVAFQIVMYCYYGYFQLDAERFDLPEDTEENRALLELIDTFFAAKSKESRTDAYNAIQEYRGELWSANSEIESRMHTMESDLNYSLQEYYRVNECPALDRYRYAKMEAERILQEDEEYQALAAQYESNKALDKWFAEFFDEVETQRREAVRNHFIQMGFIPLYGLEELYAQGEITIDNDFLGKVTLEASSNFFVLSFAGTKEQFEQIKEQIDPENEAYIIWAAGQLVGSIHT